MAAKPGKMMITRTVVVMIIVILCLSIVSGASLVNIMIINGEKYQSKASEQQLYDSLVTAPRGDIYDRNMQILATSTTAWTVYITPNGIKKISDDAKREKVRTTIAKGLSEILEVDYQTVYDNTNKNSYYVIVKKKIDKETADKVRQFIKDNKDLEITKYIGLDQTTKRYYPNDSLASVVIGFVGADEQGLAGIESYYDAELTGVAGRVVAAKNAAGTDMPFTYEKVEEAQKGNSLVLTLDSYIQHTAEKYLQTAIEQNQIAERGAAVVMNVKTGAILAMAVKGDFNPNQPFALSAEDQAKVDALEGEEKDKLKGELLNRQWRNKAVSDTYEPGSVFKVVTASIAIEENLVNKNNSFYCNGRTTVAGQGYGCWKHGGHGTQNLGMAIANSCNPAFITIGQLIGVSTFSKYFKAFGFAEKTGIDLPGESRSTYHKEEKMGVVELASSSFGQTFNVTPVQLLSAISAAVNGGYLVQPHLLEKTVDENGKVVKTTTTTYKRQVISETTSATMRELMEYVAQNGAKNSLVTGYRIGAKTGTSQKVAKIQQTGDKYLYIGSCATVAPIDDPEIAVFVMLDEPKGSNYYGGVISAPVNSKIMADVLPYLGYEPSYTEEELKKLAIEVPDTVGLGVDDAKGKLTTAKLQYKIVGSGEKVIRQLPEAGNKVISGGVVILYTEQSENTTVTVPDFRGLTATEANTAAANAGVNIEFSGNTATGGLKAYNQSVAPGTSVEAGSIITVYFRDETTVD
ncbi:MAG: penicillin-binding transpeptidase domain-containing protein [Acutalibacteraceae bacterium]|nr:penicillin-binding transpeptidase domain-containing protein [Acutalibacteraceae bacterium]